MHSHSLGASAAIHSWRGFSEIACPHGLRSPVVNDWLTEASGATGAGARSARSDCVEAIPLLRFRRRSPLSQRLRLVAISQEHG